MVYDLFQLRIPFAYCGVDLGLKGINEGLMKDSISDIEARGRPASRTTIPQNQY